MSVIIIYSGVKLVIKKDEIILVEVTGFINYGVFVKKDDYVGLIHISEISDRFVKNINLFAKVGDRVSAYVLDVDHKNKKMKLSYKKCGSERKIVVPASEIGFEGLKRQLPKWVKNSLKKL